MALGDRFAINVAGDSVDVVVVFEGYTEDENGWQDTWQVVKLDNDTFVAQTNLMQLCWPTTKQEASRAMADHMAKNSL